LRVPPICGVSVEPSTTDMQSLRGKGLQGGFSQRHRVVMTCETISHYHQLEIQHRIATAKAPV